MRTRSPIVASALLITACAQSPTGRPQLILVSDEEMTRMGIAAFDEVKAETPQTKNEELSRYAQCVAAAIVKQAAPTTNWDVRVFESTDINAFALPGGKVGVYTGILGVTENQDQLASVLAHEVAHVVARHSNARVSAALATDTSLQLSAALAGTSTPAKRQIFGLIGAGTQVGILLPYSRDQETEADVLGLDYMSKAGFEPRAAVALWRNMQKVSGNQPPTFLSTHPSHEGRIEELTRRMPAALQQYEAARQAGKTPRCIVATERSAEATTR